VGDSPGYTRPSSGSLSPESRPEIMPRTQRAESQKFGSIWLLFRVRARVRSCGAGVCMARAAMSTLWSSEGIRHCGQGEGYLP